jgi:plastocyanin
MVMFVTSLVGAAAILARATSAIPSNYGSGSASSAAPMMMESASPMMMGSAPPMMMESAAPSSAMSAASSYQTPSSQYGSGSSSYSSSSYGSGSSNWNMGSYDSCVQQCVAQFGAASAMYMPPSATASSGSYGSGSTHTVWVAPTQGVLRYVPFAVNASVGDTVKFIWGANNHTVTKSSELSLCNKTGDQPFASGEQNKTFVFTQMVNDTNPTFYYCGTPTHCEKGMFGIINPPNAFGQNGSAGMMMPSLAMQYPSTQAAMTYASNCTSSQPMAAAWGTGIDMSGMPSWAQSYAAENIMFTQSFLAMNSEVMSSSGAVDLAPLANNPIMMPTDVANQVRLSSTDGYGSNTTSSSAAASPSSSSTTNSAASKGGKNGAAALSSPRVAVAFVAVAAAFFAL